ncbi:hypothetical protein OF122_16675 [Pelagibacterium flavum]|uniref:Uncharacterized protein n=1 Tax=Pelagibacterium flavum TaxID=2984530 RepID=A0ABY6IR03_9HYPH|nr:hypothetical protein [Pelagibacterium sp. YIM 151497]MAN75910.1 hypothetical protein [Hyphomicrobiales bacterium]UYQ71655.1 hypothetical protein OF122_16675 [Pelagibacterium sp. YIM 151497]|tara:strand:- start:1524 stop:1766 length:243 start_codon:yes stop_codon:yes gene_type:complete
MQVMVFMSKAADNPGHKATLLALPRAPEAAIPNSLQHLEWTYYAEMDASDVSLGGPTARVEERIRKDGYAEVPFRLNPRA